jgi:protein-disulfide isomerase
MGKKHLRIRISSAGLLAASAVFVLSAHTMPARAPAPAALEILYAGSEAPISIVVFSDYACRYSSQLYFQLEELEKEHPSQLRVMMKQTPLPIHPQSPLAHEAALAAAAQGKLAAMSELLFANQNRLDRDSLLAYARQLHLNSNAFRTALDTHEYRAIVEEDLLEAGALGIDATPTLFVNGHRLDGFQDLKALDEITNKELAKDDASRQAAPRQAESQANVDGDSIRPEVFARLAQSAAEVRGPATAPVTIVEFSDFQCPFCRQTVKPLEGLLAQRPNEVRLIFRSFPLDFHRYSELAHEAALAAGAQGKFWPMHDLIFASQSRLERADLLRYAAQLNLDMPAFEHALDAHIYAGQIAADRALGAELDVSGTPTMFINGKRLTGARSLVELEELADEQARIAHGSSTQQVVVAPKAEHDTDFVVLGSDSAPIPVLWFTDVRSPLAIRAAALLRAIDQAYPGKLRIEYKTMELANHADAELASRALLAAGARQKFWPMFEAIARRDIPLDRDAVVRESSAIGLDTASFPASLEDASVTESIELDQAEVARRAVTGSPAIFIGGVRIDGLQPLRVYKDSVEAALASHNSLAAASGR